MEHHAQLYIHSGSLAEVVPSEFQTPSADVAHIVVQQFTVDDSRALGQQATTRPVDASHRVFVVQFVTITHEAQNALLKLLEEPPETSRFILITPRADRLLPTVVSRLQVRDDAGEEAKNEVFAAWLAASYADRIAEIAARIKKEDSQWLNAIQRGIAEYATHPDATAAAKETILFFDTYAGRRGSSLKMLLEDVALALPVGGKRDK